MDLKNLNFIIVRFLEKRRHLKNKHLWTIRSLRKFILNKLFYSFECALKKVGLKSKFLLSKALCKILQIDTRLHAPVSLENIHVSCPEGSLKKETLKNPAALAPRSLENILKIHGISIQKNI